MRVLVDSATLIWWFADSPQLGSEAERIIEDPATEAFVSVASIWEISLKRGIGKMRFEGEVSEWMDAGLMYDLPVQAEHAVVAGALPLHHRDPFDRMLVAQAQVEGLALLTPDGALRRYDVPVIDART